MLKNELAIACAIVSGQPSNLEGLSFFRVRWFDILQLIQSVFDESVEEKEAYSGTKRAREIRKNAYDRVRGRAAEFKVELPLKYPWKK